MPDPKVPFKRGSDIIDAANLPFEPAVLANWTGSADPGSTKAALDQVASRVTTLEAGVPAGEVTYTPADTNDWPGADPTTVSGALDLVADRTAALEVVAAYTPGDVTDWNGGADPGTLVQGVDQLADRTKTNETALAALANAAADIATLFSNANTIAAAQRTPTITIAAEAAEAIDVSITQVDGLGNAVAVADRILLEAFSDQFYTTATAAAAFPVTDNGAGSVAATDAGVVKVLFNTSAAGALQIRITDTATGSANTLYFRGTYLGATGVRISAAPFFFQVTFTA